MFVYDWKVPDLVGDVQVIYRPTGPYDLTALYWELSRLR